MPGFTPALRLFSYKDYTFMKGDKVLVNKKSKYVDVEGIIVHGAGGSDRNPSYKVAVVLSDGTKTDINIVQSFLKLRTNVFQFPPLRNFPQQANLPVAVATIPLAQVVLASPYVVPAYSRPAAQRSAVTVAVAVAVPVRATPLPVTSVAVEELVRDVEGLTVHEDTPFIDISDTWDVPKSDEVATETLPASATISEEGSVVTAPAGVEVATEAASAETVNEVEIAMSALFRCMSVEQQQRVLRRLSGELKPEV